MEQERKEKTLDPVTAEEIEAGYRRKYIEYISRLFERMDICSLERMLDQAIDEIL